MRRALIGALIVVAACGSSKPAAPVAGTVTRLTYHPETVIHGSQCIVRDKSGWCTMSMPTEDRTPEWWEGVVVTDGDKVNHLRLFKAVFDECRVGARYEAARCVR